MNENSFQPVAGAESWRIDNHGNLILKDSKREDMRVYAKDHWLEVVKIDQSTQEET